jgi:hypothetical protein
MRAEAARLTGIRAKNLSDEQIRSVLKNYKNAPKVKVLEADLPQDKTNASSSKRHLLARLLRVHGVTAKSLRVLDAVQVDNMIEVLKGADESAKRDLRTRTPQVLKFLKDTTQA